jgi:hypothetical protein
MADPYAVKPVTLARTAPAIARRTRDTAVVVLAGHLATVPIEDDERGGAPQTNCDTAGETCTAGGRSTRRARRASALVYHGTGRRVAFLIAR